MIRFKKFKYKLLLVFFVGIFIVYFNNCFCFAKIKKNNSNKKATVTYTVQGYFIKGSYANTFITYYLITNKESEKFGIADVTGKIIIPCQYDKISRNNGGIIVEQNGKKGVFSFWGKNILPVEFDNIECKFGNFVTTIANKQSIYSSNGELLFSKKYDKITPIIKNKFLLENADEYFLYNVEKKEVIKLPYDKISRFHNYLLIEKNAKKGLYSYNDEKVVIPVKYDNIKLCTDGNFIVSINGKKGLLDLTTLKFLIPPVYKDLEMSFQFGLFLLKKQTNNFDLAHIYKENKQSYAVVFVADTEKISDQKLWHIVYKHKKGRIIYIPTEKGGLHGVTFVSGEKPLAGLSLPYEYEDIAKTGKFYKIKKNGKFALFDIFNQKFCTDFSFDDFENIGLRYFKVKNNGKYALLNLDTNNISNFEYEDIRLKHKYHNNHIQVKKNGKWKYLNRTKVIRQGIANGLYTTGLLIISPVVIPVAVTFMALIYSSCSSPKPKYPKYPKELKCY